MKDNDKVLLTNNRLVYPTTHRWIPVDSRIIAVFGRSTPITINNTNSDKIDIDLTDKNDRSKTVKILIRNTNGNKAVVSGSIETINKAFRHYYPINENNRFQATKHAAVIAIIRSVTQSALLQRLSKISVGTVPCDQILTSAELDNIIKRANSFVNNIRVIRQKYKTNKSISYKLHPNCDILLVDDHYVNNNKGWKIDSKLIDDKRYQSRDGRTITHLLINKAIGNKHLLPIVITENGRFDIIDLTTNSKIRSYPTNPDLTIDGWNYSEDLQTVTCTLSNRYTIMFNNNNVKIRTNNSTIDIRLNTFKSLLYKSKDNTRPTTWADDTNRVNTFFNHLSTNNVNINNTRISSSDLQHKYEELQPEQQTNFTTLAYVITDFIDTVGVDSLLVMLYYIIYSKNNRFRHTVFAI